MSTTTYSPDGRWYWDGYAWRPVLMGRDSRIKHTNHLLHLIIVLLTGGLWLPFYAIIAIANRHGTVDA